MGGEKRKFGSLVRWLGYELRRAKDSRKFYPFFQLTPHSRRCDSCEVRPAVHSEFDPEGKLRWYCEVCRLKRKYSFLHRSLYLRMFEEFLEGDGKGSLYLKGNSTPSAGRPQDLNELGKFARGKAEGYVGVIYADGNDIGRRVEASGTPAEFRTLSEELLRVTRGAVFWALAENEFLRKKGDEDKYCHPFEIISIGGDDVFLIVPGDVALDVALAICRKFQDEFAGELTMSAGVLIMPSHYPIYYARNVVEMLLKSAKKAGRLEGSGPPRAYVDFQVVTGDTSLSEDVEGYRKKVYSNRPPFRETYRMIQRPYTLEGLGRLLEVARWVGANFPASQLYQLRKAMVEHAPMWAQNWYRYQLSRGGEVGEKWQELHRRLFGTEPFEDDSAPWRWDGEGYSTPILDLVEMMDYVRPREGWDED